MKKLLGLDPLYEKMKKINLLDSIFEEFNSYHIRKLAMECMQDSTPKTIQQIIHILNEENNSSLLTLKILLFLNALINNKTKTEDDSMIDIVTNQINKLLEIEKKRLTNIQKSRIHVSSVEKTMKWIKGRLSVSKNKTETEIKNKETPNNFITKDKSKLSEKSPKHKNTNTIENESSNLQGKEELLIDKIILPYATYLQKLSFTQINFTSLKLQVEEIWKIINLIKCLYQITCPFQIMLRYYSKEYIDIVFFVFHIVDYETKILYPLLEKYLKPRIEQANQSVLEIYEKEKNERKRTELLKTVSEKYAFEELKELIDELSSVNEMIINLYLGRNTYDESKKRGIIKPNLFGDPKLFSFIYDILKDIEKSNSLSKRLSRSKEKKLSNHTPRTIPSEFQFIKDMKTPIFTQKRQKLTEKLKEESENPPEKNITLKNNNNLEPNQLTTKEIINEEKTFRKIRLNTTNQNIHLQETNSRTFKF